MEGLVDTSMTQRTANGVLPPVQNHKKKTGASAQKVEESKEPQKVET